MRLRKISKKGEIEVSMISVIVALVLVFVVLLFFSDFTGNVIDNLLDLFKIKGKPDPTDSASFASFDRLNDEIKWMLEESEEQGTSRMWKTLPYTLGGKFTGATISNKYLLVGFNAGENSNQCLLDSADIKKDVFSVPDKCAKSQVACLCLCSHDKGCTSEECVVYKDVDYFISYEKNSDLQEGNVMQGLKDPITGEDVNCLVFKGQKLGVGRWATRNIHLELIKRGPDTYVFISQEDDDTRARLGKQCKYYTEEELCAETTDDFGVKCVPDYNLFGIFKGCEACPDECEMDYYSKDWLKDMNPCDCAE